MLDRSVGRFTVYSVVIAGIILTAGGVLRAVFFPPQQIEQIELVSDSEPAMTWMDASHDSSGGASEQPAESHPHQSATHGKSSTAGGQKETSELKPGPCHPVFPPEPEAFRLARQKMVQFQLRSRDISDPRVLHVMGRIPRHEFVPEDVIVEAYDDHPLPIGYHQTISQPYIVALMTQLARPQSHHRALDIGTGSGYQAAILAELCREVYSIEIVEPLAREAAERLKRLGYTNVVVKTGDGYRGWPEKAPFDVIIVAAAPDHVPQPLLDQLAVGGRLVIPVGRVEQQLLVIEKQPDGSIRRESVAPVLFVPMTGEAQRRSR
ncbi:MAG: protein-L-isoaspartate(D-aspartate) O-methyltransferase [Thermogutta sp.]